MAQTATAAPTQTAPVKEEKKNCVGCNKPLKKAKRYYRNGNYYCNKNCWRVHRKSQKKE